MKQTLKNFFGTISRYGCFSKMKKMGNTRVFDLWCDGKADESCLCCPYFIENCSLLTNSRGNRSKEGEYYP